MANTWNPGEEGITPSYTNSLAEFDPATRATASKAAKSSDAKDLLRNSENTALTKNEATPWKNNVGGNRKKSNPKSQKGKGRIGSKNRNGIAALLLAISLTVAGGAFIGGSHSLLMPGTATLTDLVTNTQDAAIMNRTKQVIAGKLSNLNQSGWAGIFNEPSDTYSARLDDYGNAKINGNSIDFDGNTITGNDFIDVYDNNSSLRSDINDSIYNRAGGYYSDLANDSFYDTGNTRNVFRNFEQTGDSATNEANFKNTMNEQLDGRITTNLSTTKEEEVEKDILDEDGNKTGQTEIDTEQVRNDAETRLNSIENYAEAEAAANSYISTLAGRVSKVANWGCTAFRVGTMISIAHAVGTKLQYITNFLGLTENYSKTMAGDGNKAAANEVLNMMTRSYTNTSVPNLKTAHATSMPDESAVKNENINFNDGSLLTIETGDEEIHSGSMVEADAFRAILTESTPSSNAAYNYAPSSASNIIITLLGQIGITNTYCAAAQGGVAAVSLAITIIPGIGQAKAIGSVAWSGLKSIIANLAKQIGMSVFLNVAVAGIVSFMVPLIARSLMSNAIENYLGYDAGQVYAAGAGFMSETLARNATGQSLASEDVAIAYNKVTQDVIAQEAEVDRLNRSPFDLTSKNTFLGSIAYNLLPTTLFSSSSRGIVGSASVLAKTTSQAVASLTNSASANGAGSSYMTTFGDCTSVKEIGATCDVFGGEITVTDSELLDIPVDDPTYVNTIAANMENCDNNGKNCKIKDNSNLAKYISYCAKRTSPFGITDANILNDLEVGNTILNSLPIVGDALDILNAGIDIANESWANGQKCVATHDPSINPDWDKEIKYYSLYMADNHVLSQMGDYEDNSDPVLSYIQKERNEHINDSAVAQLSRILGFTEEDTQLVMDVVAYYNYIENYDANTRIAMEEISPEAKTGDQVITQYQQPTLQISQSANYKTEEKLPQTHYIIYDDIRNRSHVA